MEVGVDRMEAASKKAGGRKLADTTEGSHTCIDQREGLGVSKAGGAIGGGRSSLVTLEV